MNTVDIIKIFKYNNIDLTNYTNIKYVSSDEGFLISNNEILATTRTFSCSNVLFFNNEFAFLYHFLPNSFINRDDKVKKTIAFVKKNIYEFESCELNVLISNGISNPKELNFHDNSYILEELKNLNNITLNIFENIKSKNIVFDFKNKILFSDEFSKGINIYELKNTTLNQNKKI